MKKILLVLLYAAGVPFAASLLYFILLFFGVPEWLGYIVVPGLSALFYFLLRKKLDLVLSFWVHGGILLGLGLLFTLLMIVFSGSIRGVFSGIFLAATLPFALLWIFYTLTDAQPVLCLIIFLTYFAAFLVAVFFGKNAGRRRKVFAAVVSAAVLLFAGISTALYLNRPEVRYAGHGFQYMHGFSSTDFTEYTVYSDPTKLVQPENAPSFRIEDPDAMPVLDGAEACYPVYAAFAKAVYKDIGRIEKEYADADSSGYRRFNGKIVTFTNTVEGFLRLIYDYGDEEKYGGRVDLFFGARPSKEQMEMAENEGIKLQITPVGREAFVFFTEDDNPVAGLTSEEIRAIYHGDVTNWKQVGGKDQKITAFQRPANSGSQTMMEYFMGDVPLKEPMTYETVSSMGGVIRNVAQYHSEAGALGYTFRYFLEGLNQEKGVKLLSVDGVYPTVENIENGSYPLTVPLVIVSREDDPNPNVQRMIDFALSEEGQEIIRKTGYAGLE